MCFTVTTKTKRNSMSTNPFDTESNFLLDGASGAVVMADRRRAAFFSRKGCFARKRSGKSGARLAEALALNECTLRNVDDNAFEL